MGSSVNLQISDQGSSWVVHPVFYVNPFLRSLSQSRACRWFCWHPFSQKGSGTFKIHSEYHFRCTAVWHIACSSCAPEGQGFLQVKSAHLPVQFSDIPASHGVSGFKCLNQCLRSRQVARIGSLFPSFFTSLLCNAVHVSAQLCGAT